MNNKLQSGLQRARNLKKINEYRVRDIIDGEERYMRLGENKELMRSL
jgi:hypothetical protein